MIVSILRKNVKKSENVKIDSHVKSRFWSDNSAFKMRKMNPQNTFDAGVKKFDTGSWRRHSIIEIAGGSVGSQHLACLLVAAAGRPKFIGVHSPAVPTPVAAGGSFAVIGYKNLSI